MGFTINSLDIKSKTLFNKDGASLVQEVDIPFPEITLDIDISTDASEQISPAILFPMPKIYVLSLIHISEPTRPY